MFQRILLLWLLGTVSALAQTGAVQGHSFVGGTPSVTSGLKSANYLDGIIPHATITVYFTGTTNLVPGSQIFSNSTGTVLGNPFTSNDISSLNPGGWLFFAAQGQGYDVVGSGGLSPNTYGAPTPLCTDCFASGGGGGGGGCSTGGIPTTNGSVTGDNSSTNCGYENRVGDTSSIPATTQTFGTQLLASSSESQVLALGAGAGANSSLTDSIIAGFSSTPEPDGEVAYVSGTDVVAEGVGEWQGTSGNLCSLSKIVSLGYSNAYQCGGASFSDVNTIGDNNLNLATPSGYSLTDVHLFGDDNFVGMPASPQSFRWVLAEGYNNVDDLKTSQEVIALGDSSVTGAITATGSAVTDVIGIGDGVADGISDGSFDVIAIGDGAASVGSDATGSQVEEVAIGTDAATNATGQDIIAIGDLPLTGLNGISSTYNTGNDIIAIGDTPLACNTTGSDNVAIGDHAGSIGFTGSVCGNSNETGSHNVWIGDTAGPNTATPLSNTIAIGDQAYNTASNQVVLGNSSINSLILYGCPAGEVAYDDGTGTCVAPGTSGVSSINSTAGAFTFSFSAGAGSCSGTTCTFTGSGSGGGSVTNFIASSGSWPSWLVPTVTLGTTTPTLAVAASAIPNASLATQTANTVLGALTATTPSGLAMPSCSTSTSALEWTTGTGFGCHTITGGVSSVAGDGTLINSTPQTGAVALTLVYTPAHSGANSDITSLAGLTTALSVPQGGTGAATNTGYLIGHGTSATTSSATIPGSVISSDITHNAANLSAAALLPTGTTAATPSVNDNSAKLATTAYVNSPGDISPTSVTVTGSGPSTLGLTDTTYSALTTAFPCASNAGKIAFVTDSTTQVWGAAYTGGGALPAFVGCDGSAYGVIGK